MSLILNVQASMESWPEKKKALKKGIAGTNVYIKSSEHHPHWGLKEISDIKWSLEKNNVAV